MARTNIEETAWRRITKLAGFMECSDREAAGTAAFLWGDSQDVEQTEGSREDIIDWAHLYSLEPAETDRWIEGFVRARLVTPLPDGRFKINGNDVQIEQRISNMSRAAKGGAKTREKWAKLKAGKEGLEQASSLPEAQASATLPLGPCKAMQGNAMQTEDRSAEEAPKKFGPRELATAWNDRMSKVKSVKGKPMPLVNLDKFRSEQPRWKAARARLEADRCPKYWTEVIDRIARSQFCRGKEARGDWVADFDFLVRTETATKVMEGHYGCAPPAPVAPLVFTVPEPEHREPDRRGDPILFADVKGMLERAGLGRREGA